MKFSAAVLISFFTGFTFVAGAPPRHASSLSSSFHSHSPGRRCGSEISAARKTSHELKFQRHKKEPSAKASRNAVIDVHFHVIAANSTRAGGSIPKKQIEHQIDVLNMDYKPTGIRFKLVNVSNTVNKDWFTGVGPDSSYQSLMKDSLRNGGPETLNVYTVGFENKDTQGLLGYSTFPADYEGLPKDDGVVIQHQTLPGGNMEHFNLGRTLTHETGHWVGLYHTFQGNSCSSSGDMVADTPVQKTPTTGCPKVRPDTCPGQPGLDPIHNYMDYSDDDCLHIFTPGQTRRIKSHLRTYRNISI